MTMKIQTENNFRKGTIYLYQTLEFLRSVFPEQNVKTTVTVDSINYKKKKVNLDCKCSVEEKLVLSGTATVLTPCKKNRSNR